MEFSDNVVTLEKDDKKYYIVGTAHISRKSVEEVGHVIETVQPDTVCVELCQTRYNSLTDEKQWAKLNIMEVVKQGKALMLLANLALSSFQRKMGEKIGVKPGAELMESIKKAEEVGAEVVLADRDIQVTLKRTWANLSWWKKMNVFAGLMESVISSEEISEEDLEKLKEKDQLSEMMDEFARVMPEVKKPLIDERDQFLMSKIEEAPGKSIVAVVGAGHVKGMTGWFGKIVDREIISTLPKPGKLGKILGWTVPLVVIGLLTYLKVVRQEPIDNVWAWILPNVIFTFIGASIAGAKFRTIIAASLAAPLTSLVPVVGAGMVAGVVEAYARKPSVADCERIPEDVSSLRGFYRNPFTRVLLVFFLANLGSAIGTYVGIGWLTKLVIA